MRQTLRTYFSDVWYHFRALVLFLEHCSDSSSVIPSRRFVLILCHTFLFYQGLSNPIIITYHFIFTSHKIMKVDFCFEYKQEYIKTIRNGKISKKRNFDGRSSKINLENGLLSFCLYEAAS